jgi:hypothetical protein
VIEENQTRADWLPTCGVPPVDLRDTLALVLDDMTHADGDILHISEGNQGAEARKHLKSLRKKRGRGKMISDARLTWTTKSAMNAATPTLDAARKAENSSPCEQKFR